MFYLDVKALFMMIESNLSVKEVHLLGTVISQPWKKKQMFHLQANMTDRVIL
jgi:hypothetical protein